MAIITIIITTALFIVIYSMICDLSAWWKGGKGWLQAGKLSNTINNLNWWHRTILSRESRVQRFNRGERRHRLTTRKIVATLSWTFFFLSLSTQPCTLSLLLLLSSSFIHTGSVATGRLLSKKHLSAFRCLSLSSTDSLVSFCYG